MRRLLKASNVLASEVNYMVLIMIECFRLEHLLVDAALVRTCDSAE